MKTLIILLAVLFVGCTSDTEYKRGIETHFNEEFVVQREGCEYFVNRTYGFSRVYTHKGNCINPIHCYNK